MTSLRALLVAHTTSAVGNTATLIAVPLHVLATGGGGVELGITTAAAVVPVVVGGVFGGTIVDRIGYRRTSIVSDFVGAATIAAIPLLAGTVGLPFWGLVALLVLTGLLDAPGQTARQAMLPELCEAAGVPLLRATGLFSGAERLSRLLGTAVTAALVGLFGALPVLWIDAATFLLSALLVLLAVPHVRAQGTTGNYLEELRAGFDVVRRDVVLRAVVALVFLTNVLDTAGTVLLPLVADEVWGRPELFGWINAAFGLGAAIGAVGAHRLTVRWSRRAVFTAAFLIAGGPRFLLLAFGASFEVFLVTSLLIGLTAGAVNPIIGALQLERVEPRMRARVGGFVSAGAWAGMPGGALVAGWSAEQWGLVPVLAAVGVLYLVVTLHPLLGRSWRGMDRPVTARVGVPS